MMMLIRNFIADGFFLLPTIGSLKLLMYPCFLEIINAERFQFLLLKKLIELLLSKI